MPNETPKVDVEKVKFALASLRAEATKRAGEVGFNPFIWMGKTLDPLEAKFSANPTAENANAILTLKVPLKTEQDKVLEVSESTVVKTVNPPK